VGGVSSCLHLKMINVFSCLSFRFFFWFFAFQLYFKLFMGFFLCFCFICIVNLVLRNTLKFLLEKFGEKCTFLHSYCLKTPFTPRFQFIILFTNLSQRRVINHIIFISQDFTKLTENNTKDRILLEQKNSCNIFYCSYLFCVVSDCFFFRFNFLSRA
jgi:hypothetical protein